VRVFVTGGSGFVGRNLIAALVARGDQVVALARSDGAAATVAALGATPARGDLGDVEAMGRAMAGCAAVLHAAAHVNQHGTRAEFVIANVDGTRHVLAAARAAGVARLVHVGTEAVLADGEPIVRADETRPMTTRPAGLYPETKAAAERLVVAAARDGLATVVIRPRLIWGRGDTSVLPEMIAAVRAGKFAWVGGGRYLTSTCHVANVVEGALLALERGRSGEAYFLTDGAPVEFRGFVTAMMAAHGVDPGTRSVPRWLARAIAASTSWMKQPPITRTALAVIGGEVTVDDAKARRELGYVGRVSVEAGLASLTP
jgi:nucleoside-diphosphate-sugar epimerase